MPMLAYWAALSPIWRGASLMLVVVTCNALDTVIVRLVAQEVHPTGIAFFRNLFSLLFMLPWLLVQGRAVLVTARMPLHVGRAALKLGALACLYFALARLPLAEVTAIAFSTPLFATVGAVLLLGERLRAARWLITAVGFLGILVVLRPGAGSIELATLAAVVSAAALAGVALSVKSLARTDPPDTIVLLNLLLSAPLGLMMALPFWQTPGPAMLGWLALQGALGALAQAGVTRAMRLADASTLMPLEYLRLPLVALIAWLLFGELADGWTWAGAILIIATTFLGVRLDSARRSGVADHPRNR